MEAATIPVNQEAPKNPAIKAAKPMPIRTKPSWKPLAIDMTKKATRSQSSQFIVFDPSKDGKPPGTFRLSGESRRRAIRGPEAVCSNEFPQDNRGRIVCRKRAA